MQMGWGVEKVPMMGRKLKVIRRTKHRIVQLSKNDRPTLLKNGLYANEKKTKSPELQAKKTTEIRTIANLNIWLLLVRSFKLTMPQAK